MEKQMEKVDKMIDNLSDDLSTYFPVFYSEMINSRELKDKLPRNYMVILNSKYFENQPISRMADNLSISRTHVTAVMDQLEKEGLLKRLPDKNDRRITQVVVTSKGRKVRDECQKIFKEHTEQKLALLSSKELDELYKSIETIKKVTIKMVKANQTMK